MWKEMMDSENTALCYKVDDLCGLLSISRPTAYELVHKRDFPKIQVGRRILVPRAGLEKWLESQLNATESEVHGRSKRLTVLTTPRRTFTPLCKVKPRQPQ